MRSFRLLLWPAGARIRHRRRMDLLRLGRPAPLGSRPGHRLDAHRVRAGRVVAAPRQSKRGAHGGDRLQLVLRELRRQRRRRGGLARGSCPLRLPRAARPSSGHVPERAALLALRARRRRRRIRRGCRDAGLAERDRHDRSRRPPGRRLRSLLSPGGRPLAPGAPVGRCGLLPAWASCSPVVRRLASRCPPGMRMTPSLLALEATLCAVAGGLLAGLLSPSWERAAVTDLVVELGESRSGTLRDELARALGRPDPRGRLTGFRTRRVFVDSEGRPFALPDPGSERSVTIDRGRSGGRSRRSSMTRAVLDDPGLREAVVVRGPARGRECASPGRGARPGGRAPSIATADPRGGRRGTETPGAAASRGRGAAAGAACRAASPRTASPLGTEAASRTHRPDRGSARADAGGAPPACARAPSPCPGRSGARGRARVARRAGAGIGRGRGPGRQATGGRRGGRVLPLLGGAREHREARLRIPGLGIRDDAATDG